MFNRTPKLRLHRHITVAATVVLCGATLAACGSGGAKENTGAPASLGQTEGQVSILAWPGYVEDGSNDPAIDWVSPFEEQTGCTVTSKVYGTSDEAFNLAKSKEYDVVAASGDLTLRMVAAKEAAEVNTDLVPNYSKVFDFLKNQEWNTVDGKNYGVPHGYGANLLMYNADAVTPAPTSWDVVFDKSAEHKGKVTAYDSPIYIADAAMYLMAKQPELGITNPYALDQTQLDAAVQVLKQQRGNVSEYWSDYLKAASAFKTGNTVVGTTWQVITNTVDQPNIKATVPSEGVTGWNDTWMISSHANNVNCAYQWLNYIEDPKVNAEATEYFGEAPNSQEACSYASPGFCDTFHAGDKEFSDRIWYWRTPIEKCLDGRTNTKCTDYSQWTQAWTEIKG